MAGRDHSTVVCSIAFVDIVDYAKKSVEEQMRAREQFGRLLAQALAGVPAAERIVLDTAEGVAISFLGNPEECLYFALALRDAPNARSGDTPRLRVGINFGPVRLVKDLNGQPNLIGDGMSVGQRIVGFAEADQILAAEVFHEKLTALDPAHGRLFDFVGARTDAQVREHRVYVLNAVPAPQRKPRTTPAASEQPVAGSAWGAHILRRPPLATALAVALILLLAVALREVLHGTSVEPATEVSTEPVPPAAPAPAPVATTPTPPERPREQAPLPSAKVAEAPPPHPREAAVPTGTLRLIVLPWGEVYVDGEKRGVAPPLRDIALKPGKHRVEIRNPGFTTLVQAVDVRPGEEIRIRHRFE